MILVAARLPAEGIGDNSILVLHLLHQKPFSQLPELQHGLASLRDAGD